MANTGEPRKASDDEGHVAKRQRRGRDQTSCSVCAWAESTDRFSRMPLSTPSNDLVLPPLRRMRKNKRCLYCKLWTAGIAAARRDESLVASGYRLKTVHAVQHTQTNLNLVEFPQLLLYGKTKGLRGSIVDVARFDYLSRAKEASSVTRRVIPSTCDFALLKSWITEGEEQHLERSRLSELGTNVGEMKHLISKGLFRVVDVFSMAIVVRTAFCDYIALSYVWGDKMELLIRKNYASRAAIEQQPSTSTHHSTLDVETLPSTIRDAIEVCVRINERYLWIDALCIDQEHSESKTAVIRSMSAIYRGAKLTIVAAAGDDADAGLVGVSLERTSEECVWADTAAKGDGIVLAVPELPTALATTKWKSRAWTFQEQMLSESCLYFNACEVFFTTSTSAYREAYGLPTMPQALLSVHSAALTSADRTTAELARRQRVAAGHELDYGDYVALVQEYTTKKLTFPSDRLPAFTGFLPAFGPIQDSLAGIPLPFVADAVSWHFTCTHSRSSCINGSLTLPGSTVLPSWSWTSWQGAVKFLYKHGNTGDLFHFEKLTSGGVKGTPNGRGYQLLGAEDPESPSCLPLNCDDHGSTSSDIKRAAVASANPTQPVNYISLNMRTRRVRCQLRPRQDDDSTWNYQCYFTGQTGEHVYAGGVQIPTNLVHDQPAEHLFEFVVVGGQYSNFAGETYSEVHALIVMGSGSSCERVGFAKLDQSLWKDMVQASLVSSRWEDVEIR